MEKKTVNVDLISSCICRDAFEIGKRALSRHSYKIDIFFQSTSPFSIYSPVDEGLSRVEAEDLTYGSPWERRLILAELRKNLFERFGNDKRDSFLLLDCTDLSRSVYKLKGDVYLLQTFVLEQNKSILRDYQLEKIDPWDLPRELLEAKLDSFVSDIKQRYDLNRVIMCEAYYVDKYATRDGHIKSFSNTSEKLNDFASFCYEYLENALGKEQIHIIPMPKGVLGSELHKWGNSPRHFCPEYYQYLLSAIDCCMCDYDRQDEEQMLSALRADCESAFEKYYKAGELIAQLEAQEKAHLKEQTSLKEKLKNAEAALKKTTLLLNSEKARAQGLVKEIEDIKSSKSYKIGRFVTYIPRKITKRG